MELNWIYFVCVILCVYVKHSSEQSGLPQSPCPNMFQYTHDGREWIGTAQVQGSPLGQTTKLEVMLSLRAQLPSQFVGSVELYGTRDAAVQEIRSRQPVRYRIRFPMQNPLPKLTQISVNGQIFCTGEPETGAYVTQIRLEHTLFTEVSGQFGNTPVSGFDNNIIYPQDPYAIYNNQDNYYYSQINQRPQTTPDVRPSFTTNQINTEYNSIQPGYNTIQSGYNPIQPGYPSIQSVPNTPPPAPPAPTAPPYISQPTGSGNVECGTPHPKYAYATLIVGGDTVNRGTWPWLVAIYLNKAIGPSFNCGGNLVSPKTVVTAAHCFRTPEREYAAQEVILFLGRYNILNWNEEGVKAAQVEQIIIHSDYMRKDTSFDADIAIAIMRESVQYSEYIRPICLWEGAYSNGPEYDEGTVIGWGRDGTGNIVTPLPKKINIPMVADADCLRSSDTFRYITSERTFCAGKKNFVGPCNGDSGGGMTFRRNNKWMLRGIVSAALADPIVNTCNLGQYVVFTDAAKFVNWIRSYMR